MKTASEATEGKLKLGIFGNANEFKFAPDARVYVYQTTGGGIMGMMGGNAFSVTILEDGMTLDEYMAQVQSYPGGYDWNDEISIYFDSQGSVTELLVSKVDAGIYDPVKCGADKSKKYPVFVWLHGMGAGTAEQTQFFMSGISKLAKADYQADFHNGAAYIVAARANEDLPAGPSWLEGPGGFGYLPIEMSGMSITPGGPGAGRAGFGTGIAVYAPSLVQLILDFLKTHPNADSERIFMQVLSYGRFLRLHLLIQLAKVPSLLRLLSGFAPKRYRGSLSSKTVPNHCMCCPSSTGGLITTACPGCPLAITPPLTPPSNMV